jgi:aspartyl protease family protein
MRLKNYLVGGLGLLLSLTGWAEQKIVLLALTQDKVIMTINGQRRLLNVGKTSPEGVTLIAADSQKATLRVNGKNQVFTLGAGVSLYESEKKEPTVEVVINKDKQGLFVIPATINGTTTVDAIIDTGASAVAMNRKMAEKLQLHWRTGQQQIVDTPGGKVNSYQIVIDSIQVGAIELRNVTALIVETVGMENYILLGMTFLSRLKMINNPNNLVLVLTGQGKK